MPVVWCTDRRLLAYLKSIGFPSSQYHIPSHLPAYRNKHSETPCKFAVSLLQETRVITKPTAVCRYRGRSWNYLFIVTYWNNIVLVEVCGLGLATELSGIQLEEKPPFASFLHLLLLSSRWSGCYATAKVQGSSKCFMLIKGCSTAELLTTCVQGPWLLPIFWPPALKRAINC